MDLTYLYQVEDLIQHKHKISRVFLFRICGTGMGATATLLQEAGFEVEGGDYNFYPPMSKYLEKENIKIHYLDDFDFNYLKQFDLIIVGNVVPGKSEIARRIEKLAVPFTSFPAALGALVLQERNVVGVAGTHGKTTTTYFLAQMFEKLGFNPGFLIGGVLKNSKPSHLGENYFFIESDEYDSGYFHKKSKFNYYQLKSMILTSLEFDHGDIYENLEQICEQFYDIAPSLQGKFIFNEDYAVIPKIAARITPEVQKFCYGTSSEVGPGNYRIEGGKSFFTVEFENIKYEFSTNVIGHHNILNLTSGVLFALSEGIEAKEIQKSIQDLKMVKRRQEEKGKYHSLTIIDDFAHHPRAISETLKTIQDKYSPRSVYVVWEPASATARSSYHQQDYVEALRLTKDLCILKPQRATSIAWAEDLDCDKIAELLEKDQRQVKLLGSLKALLEEIEEKREEDAVLLVLSNGSCFGLWDSSWSQSLQKE